MTAWLEHAFGSVEALLAVVLAGVVCGVVGVHVVLRRLPFLTIGLAHATFPGLVLAGLLGIGLVAGPLLFGIVAVTVIGVLGSAERVGSSTAIGIVLSAGFAAGVLLASGSDGFARDLTSYLVGSVATVSRTDVVVLGAAGAAVTAALVLLHKELVMGAFDPAALAALGYRVRVLDLAVLVAVEVAVVAALPAMGTILAVSLVVSPAAAARLWTDRVGTAMLLAAVLGAGAGAAGLAISVAAHTAAGATVALVAGGVLAVSAAASPLHHRRRSAAPGAPA